MNKNVPGLLVWVVLIFFLFGCGQARASEFTQTRNGISAVFSLSPDSPMTMEPVTLLLALTDANGEAVEDAQVSYDLTMPGMTMPPNQQQAADEGNGLYEAGTIFTMAGNWRVEATVEYGGELISFTFDFSIK